VTGGLADGGVRQWDETGRHLKHQESLSASQLSSMMKTLPDFSSWSLYGTLRIYGTQLLISLNWCDELRTVGPCLVYNHDVKSSISHEWYMAQTQLYIDFTGPTYSLSLLERVSNMTRLK